MSPIYTTSSGRVTIDLRYVSCIERHHEESGAHGTIICNGWELELPLDEAEDIAKAWAEWIAHVIAPFKALETMMYGNPVGDPPPANPEMVETNDADQDDQR